MDIYNQKLLIDFAENHPNWLVRYVAMKKLNNLEGIHEFLIKCFKKERSGMVKGAIIQKITDDKTLFEILKTDDSFYYTLIDTSSCLFSDGGMTYIMLFQI